MILSRRKLIGGIGLLVAAPAIVRASSLMPVKRATTPEEAMAALLASMEKTIHACWQRAYYEMVVYGQAGVFIGNDGTIMNVPPMHLLFSPTAAGESAA